MQVLPTCKIVEIKDFSRTSIKIDTPVFTTINFIKSFLNVDP